MCEICAELRPFSDTCDLDSALGLLTQDAPDSRVFAIISEGSDAAAGTSTAYSMSVGDTFSGSLSFLGDNDWIQINLQSGTQYEIELFGVGSSAVEDTYLRIYNANGSEVASNDDGGPGRDSAIGHFTATSSGTYYISAGSFSDVYSGDYNVEIEEAAPVPVFTHDEIAEQLTDGFWDFNGQDRRAFNVAPGGTLTVDINDLTSEGRFLATTALAAWSEVSGINFSFISGSADIEFDDDDSGAYSTTNTSGNTILSSFVNVSTNWLDTSGTSLDSYSFQTYIHEIGHALGLGHAGNYNGTGTYGVDNSYLNDSWQATVMSYFDQDDNTFIDADHAYILTPMIADILAIQDLYGTASTLRTGDTVYGENSTAGGYYDQFTTLSGDVAFTIIDNGGIDTVDFGQVGTSQFIDLSGESISDVNGLVGNMSIARGTVIENAIGGKGLDTILGNSAANALYGGGGADMLEGRAGGDRIYGGDRADEIYGGSGDDTIYGGRLADDIYGGNGEDLLFGGYGLDNVYGGDGDDRLYGGGQNTDLFGGSGNDRIYTQSADDRISGSAGNDTAIFNASVALTVDLNITSAQNTGFGTDTITGIENLTGGDAGDMLWGNDSANILTGGAGSDTLYGRDGIDTIFGGDNADTLYGGAGNDHLNGGNSTDVINGQNGADVIHGGNNADQIYGGAGNDQLFGGSHADSFHDSSGNDTIAGGNGSDTLYLDSGVAASVDLRDNSAQSTGAGNDTINGIENVIGGSAADTFVGNYAANTLTGNGGADTLNGLRGDDTLSGGAGRDRLIAGGGNDVLEGGAHIDTFVFGGNSDTNIISDFENGSDQIEITGGASRFSNLTITDAGSDAVIAFANTTITLENFDHNLLGASDFNFV